MNVVDVYEQTVKIAEGLAAGRITGEELQLFVRGYRDDLGDPNPFEAMMMFKVGPKS